MVVSGSVDASSPGTYALTYTVSDPAGNTTTVTRQVEVASGLIEGGVLYPIAVSKDSLTDAVVGDVVANIFNGSKPGNFGWLALVGQLQRRRIGHQLESSGQQQHLCESLQCQ